MRECPHCSQERYGRDVDEKVCMNLSLFSFWKKVKAWNLKYRGKILTDQVAFVAEGIIRGTCTEMSIKIINLML